MLDLVGIWVVYAPPIPPSSQLAVTPFNLGTWDRVFLDLSNMDVPHDPCPTSSDWDSSITSSAPTPLKQLLCVQRNAPLSLGMSLRLGSFWGS